MRRMSSIDSLLDVGIGEDGLDERSGAETKS